MRIIKEEFVPFEDLDFEEKVKEIVKVFESSRLSIGEIKKKMTIISLKFMEV